MKKILGMALSIIILCQSVLVAVSVPVTPVVLVAGYSSTNLFENADSDERQQVWKLETDTLLQQWWMKASAFSRKPCAKEKGLSVC
jgi:hypothetical protein